MRCTPARGPWGFPIRDLFARIFARSAACHTVPGKFPHPSFRTVLQLQQCDSRPGASSARQLAVSCSVAGRMNGPRVVRRVGPRPSRFGARVRAHVIGTELPPQTHPLRTVFTTLCAARAAAVNGGINPVAQGVDQIINNLVALFDPERPPYSAAAETQKLIEAALEYLRINRHLPALQHFNCWPLVDVLHNEELRRQSERFYGGQDDRHPGTYDLFRGDWPWPHPSMSDQRRSWFGPIPVPLDDAAEQQPESIPPPLESGDLLPTPSATLMQRETLHVTIQAGRRSVDWGPTLSAGENFEDSAFLGPPPVSLSHDGCIFECQYPPPAPRAGSPRRSPPPPAGDNVAGRPRRRRRPRGPRAPYGAS